MLYSAYKIKHMALKNRWIMLAMHTGFAEGNALIEREFAFYEARAKGGAAAVTFVLGVNHEGSLTGMHHCEALDQESLRELARRVQQYGCKLFVQLFHCGRNESGKHHGDKPLLAPSAVPSSIFRTEPKAMTGVDITKTIGDFAKTAAFCKEAEVDAVEVSASAGYLLSEFLSPVTNLREDAYGYGKQKGTKFPLEVLQAVRERVGDDYPVLMKVSAAQMVEDGYGLEETIEFCRSAKGYIDCITVTGGWHESPVEQISYHVSKGAYAPLAGMIRKYTELPVIACNRIQDGATAQRLLHDGLCDLVGTARAFLCDGEFANKVERDEPFLPCQGCNRCIMGVLKGKEIACAFCPEAGKEAFENQRRKIATRKEVVVLGGGPAGMEAAKKAAERGFMTTLITEENALGGQFRVASLPPKKQCLMDYVAYMEHCLQEQNVTIRYETKADMNELLEKKPYFTVIAIGSRPTPPNIEGAKYGMFATDILKDPSLLPPQTEEGQIIIIGGGSVGLETAAYIKAQDPNRNIKVLECSGAFGKDLGSLARPLLTELKAQGVQLMADTKADAIEKDRVLISIGDQTFFLRADAVVLATGSRPNETEEFATALMDERLSYAVIGDAEEIGDGAKAIADGYDLFTRLYLA